MNALDRYLTDTGENIAKLAARCGCAPSTLTRPLRGERNASIDVARKVEVATSGQVPASEFLAICIDAQKRLEAAA